MNEERERRERKDRKREKEGQRDRDRETKCYKGLTKKIERCDKKDIGGSV